MKHFRIRKGARISAKGAPSQQIETRAGPTRSALVGADFPGLRPAFKVAEGVKVAEGDPLFVDRRHPAVVFSSPVTGRVVRIAHGPRRTLSSVVVEAETANEPPADSKPIAETSATAIRDSLLARGMWPAFRTRPFGVIPSPEAVPEAIFVNAVHAGTHCPDPTVVLNGRLDVFRHGLDVLTRLTDGMVHLNQDSGAELCPGVSDRIQVTTFGGRHAAALAGTHIHRLHPVSDGVQVWSIGYQDVVAIGSLFMTGRYDGCRIIALAGPRAARPRLIRTPLGADLRALSEGETTLISDGSGVRVLSGDAITGRPAAFVGRYHDQITIKDAPSRQADARRSLADAPRALIPTAALEDSLPFDIIPVPLMRALAVGDTEAAHRLGCLELIEEDVALLSRRCTSGADYGALLRGVLDELAKDAT